MQINLIFDPSISDAPAGFTTAMQYAAKLLDRMILNNITINIQVGWNECGDAPLPSGASAVGIQSTFPVVSYSQLRSYLSQNTSTSSEAIALAHLPTTDPSNGAGFWISSSEQKAWGLLPANGTDVDGFVGFNNIYPLTFDPNNRSAPGQIDFIGAAVHELTHALGRESGLQPGWSKLTTLDLFQYSAPGSIQTTPASPAYFSIDGGVTNLNPFDTKYDAGDWASTVKEDAFGYLEYGVAEPISPADLTLLSALGFNVASTEPITNIAYLGATPIGSIATLAGGATNTDVGYGFYYDAKGVTHGYVYADARFTTVDVSTAGNATGSGTNVQAVITVNSGSVAFGTYQDSAGKAHGFKEALTALGSVTSSYTFDNPLGVYGTTIHGANTSQVVGWYIGADLKAHGFVLTSTSGGDTQYNTLNEPAGANGTAVTGVSSDGRMTGFYVDSSSAYHGFVYQNGQFADVKAPNAAIAVIPEAINSSGLVVGAYEDTNKAWHGFAFSSVTGYSLPIDYLNANLSAVTGINDSGVIVGVATTDAGSNISYTSHLTLT